MFKGALFLLMAQGILALKADFAPPLPPSEVLAAPEAQEQAVDLNYPMNWSEVRRYVVTMDRVALYMDNPRKKAAAFVDSGITPERFHVIAKRFDTTLVLLNGHKEAIVALPLADRPTFVEILAVKSQERMFREVEAEIERQMVEQPDGQKKP